MKRWWPICALLAASGAALAQAGCQKVVVTADPEYPALCLVRRPDAARRQRGCRSGRAAGHAPALLRYVGPFVRVLQNARLGEVDIVTELKRNAEREGYLAFGDTPIFVNPSSVFVRADQNLKFTKREDLRGLRGGVTHGTRFGDGLDEYIEANLNVEVGPGIKENFLKLDAARIDYFISPHYPALSHLISSGTEARFRGLKPPIAEARNYVGWSRRSACLARLPEFDAVMKRYLAAMSPGRLVEESHEAWRRNPVMKR